MVAGVAVAGGRVGVEVGSGVLVGVEVGAGVGVAVPAITPPPLPLQAMPFTLKLLGTLLPPL